VSKLTSPLADLIAHGVKPEQIGVLSPYNGQVRLLKEALLPANAALEIGRLACVT
jgi:superfamily I DNA and/or RNA helicase